MNENKHTYTPWFVHVEVPAGMKNTLAARLARRRSRTILVRIVFAVTVYYTWSFSDPNKSVFLSEVQNSAPPPGRFNEPKNGEPELHEITVLTYSDRVTQGLCRSMVTAACHGFELGILGVDEMSFSSFAAIRR